MVGPTEERRPLSGVIICCTGISPDIRDGIEERIHQMGGNHKLDLVSDVTHLMVGTGGTKSEKYRYIAKNRPEVKVMHPDWVDALRKAWIEDSDASWPEIERKHMLLTFGLLRICLTGFDDMLQRQEIADLVIANGAEFHGDLSDKVTHLVCSRPEGLKYEAAMKWGLYCVSLEWCFDSLERGMGLDERLYDPRLPKAQRGQNAWARPVKQTIGKRQRAGDSTGHQGDQASQPPTKMRRTLSSRQSSHSVNIWTEIASHTSQNGDARPKVLQPSGSHRRNEGQENGPDRRPVLSRSGSRVERLGREADVQSKSPLDGCAFLIHGFKTRQTMIIKRHLQSYAATIVENRGRPYPENSEPYLLVPHDIYRTEEARRGLQALRKKLDKPIIVTDWWLEYCLEQRKLASRTELPGATPFPCFPLAGMEGLSVACTGYTGRELKHISLMTRLAGATFSETLSKETSILLVNPASLLHGQKLKSAWGWGLPTVSGRWLSDCMGKGEKLDHCTYLLQPTNERSPRKGLTKDEAERKSEVEAARRQKGKKVDLVRPSKAAVLKDSTHGAALGKTFVQPRTSLDQTTSRVRNIPNPKESSLTKKLRSAESSKTSHHVANPDPTTALTVALNQASSSLSLSSAIPTTANSPSSTRRRVIGRATKSVSSFSLPSPSKAPSTTTSIKSSEEMCRILGVELEEPKPVPQAPPSPSQQLIYDDPDTRAAREKLRSRNPGVPWEKRTPEKVKIRVAVDDFRVKLPPLPGDEKKEGARETRTRRGRGLVG